MITWPTEIDGIRLLELLGVWAAAFATFYTARTAVKIASEQNAPKLNPSIEAGFLFVLGERIPVINVAVSNTGLWDVTINGLHLSHWFQRKGILISGFNSAHGSQLPCRIASAENRNFFTSEGKTHEEWARDVARELLSGRSHVVRPIILRTLRVDAQAGNGKKYSGRVGPDLSKLLRETARVLKNES